MLDTRFDVIVIGAGPGGYVAAIRCAQLGFNVACIDSAQNSKGQPAPGGTCTNVGCIPSKALLQSSEYMSLAQHHFSEHGIQVKDISLNLEKMMGRKNEVVAKNNEGILYLFNKNKVKFFHGCGKFEGKTNNNYSIGITPVNQSSAPLISITAPHIIIATGSLPRPFPSIDFDETQILSNTGALSLRVVPQRLGVIGAGVIGLEMGSVWRRLGSEVKILEAMPELLATADANVSREALKCFNKQGMEISLGVKIKNISKTAKEVKVEYLDAAGKLHQNDFDKLIVSIGRLPLSNNLELAKVGIETDQTGFIVVNDHCQTSAAGVWAIGDVVRGPMLAHKAEEEGIAVSERIAGKHGHVDFSVIPWVIYTNPEIAWVGKTEQQLKQQGMILGKNYRVGNIPFAANGRARALGDTTGFVKVISTVSDDTVIGVHIIGHNASELIAEAAMAMNFSASAEDIAMICHAHPTLSENLKEAALAAYGKSINF